MDRYSRKLRVRNLEQSYWERVLSPKTFIDVDELILDAIILAKWNERAEYDYVDRESGEVLIQCGEKFKHSSRALDLISVIHSPVALPRKRRSVTRFHRWYDRTS